MLVFRVVQEALANVYSHASASKASLELRRVGTHLHVIDTDNARGIDARREPHKPHRPGIGIRGIRMRLNQLGGGQRISRPQTGPRPAPDRSSQTGRYPNPSRLAGQHASSPPQIGRTHAKPQNLSRRPGSPLARVLCSKGCVLLADLLVSVCRRFRSWWSGIVYGHAVDLA